MVSADGNETSQSVEDCTTIERSARQATKMNRATESSTLRSDRPQPNNWTWHVGIGLAVPVLGLLMTTGEDGTVALAFLPEHPLPMFCLIRKYFDFDCLTCGMTHSIILLLHGRTEQSLAHHSLGWLVLLVILLQIPYGIQLYLRGAAAWRPSSLLVVGFWTALFAALVIVRLGNW